MVSEVRTPEYVKPTVVGYGTPMTTVAVSGGGTLGSRVAEIVDRVVLPAKAPVEVLVIVNAVYVVVVVYSRLAERSQSTRSEQDQGTVTR